MGAKWYVKTAWVAVGDTNTLRRTREKGRGSRPEPTQQHGPDGVLPDRQASDCMGQECTVHNLEVDFQDGA